jgi:hypothetical protein
MKLTKTEDMVDLCMYVSIASALQWDDYDCDYDHKHDGPVAND